MGLADRVAQELEKHIDPVLENVHKMAKYQKEIQSGQYNEKHVNTVLTPAYYAAKGELMTQKDKAMFATEHIFEEYKNEHLHDDDMRGSEITDDAKLLNAGIQLRTEDLELMFDRNKGNKTMEKLIDRYAREHGINIGRQYVPSMQAVESEINNARSITRIFLEHWITEENAHEMLHTFFYDCAGK